MHAPTTTPSTRPRAALALLLVFAATLLLAPAGEAAGPRPLFQLPFACGQTWAASTYSNHWPDPDSIDLAQRTDGANVSEGEPVLASAAGTVLEAYTRESDGENRVFIDHGGGWVTHYIHLESVSVTKGRTVAQGEQIGRTGATGIEDATAADMHLHYSQLKDGDAVRIAFNGKLIDTYEADPSSWGTWGDDDAEELTSLNCPGNSFAGYTENGDQYEFLYKPGTGAAKIVRLDDDGTGVTTTMSETWTKSWTHFTPFTLSGGQRMMFSYKSSSGRVAFMRFDAGGSGTTTVSDGTWGKGWTHFVPFSRGGKPYFVAYNSLFGYVNVDRINAAGTGSTTIGGGTWTKGWTQLVPIDLNGHLYLLLYKGGTGAVKMMEIAGDGDDVSLSERWSGTWTTGWTHLVPLAHRESVHLLGYKAATGKVKLMKVNGGGQGVQTRGEAAWTTPWTTFSPLQLGNDGAVLIHKTGTGSAKVLRLNAPGKQLSTIWTASWTTGWA